MSSMLPFQKKNGCRRAHNSGSKSQWSNSFIALSILYEIPRLEALVIKVERQSSCRCQTSSVAREQQV